VRRGRESKARRRLLRLAIVRHAFFSAILATTLAIAGVAARSDEPADPAARGGAPKVLRYAFRVAETGFDPAQITDLYSRILAANIFEAPYEYELLARPVRLRPLTAAALPEVSDDFKTFTVRLRPGIYFSDDPAFHGKPRELIAADYVYSIKRHFDPHWKSPSFSTYDEYGIVGLQELRAAALAGKPFDYDRDVPGLRALDRYTLQIRLERPAPRFIDRLSDPAVVGAVAREVVEAWGDRVMEHPVGTGPFVLSRWQRSSLIVLDRNPVYREVRYDEEPPPGDPLAQAAARGLKGRRLPMVDRVEVSIIEENQPRWLAFLNQEMDVLEQVPEDFASIALPNNQLAPHLARRGIYAVRYDRSDDALSYFAMENPVVGGYTPEKVALRRAIALAVDIGAEIRNVRRNQAIPGQSPIPPGNSGYDPAFRSEMSEFDRAKAKALLDLYGYVDRDGDGWREQPDGSPLVIEYATQPDDSSRQLITEWKKNMDAIGVRMIFRIAKWPENLKASRAGKLMMWGVGWSGGPDGSEFLVLGYGPSSGQSNHARFQLAEFDRLYDLQRRLPDGPERLAVMTKAKELMIAYMPYKVHVHRIYTDLAQPWVIGFHRNVFMRQWWKYVDIDLAEKIKRAK
jgi:ABC-type transport system substrate-binding protein